MDMPEEKLQRARKSNYIFVLWGDGFEEAVAATFITQLRNVGLCVRLVALGSQRARGQYGLTLLADITVTKAQALAHSVNCIIIPCNANLLSRTHCDPQFTALLVSAQNNHAQFIIREPKALATPLCQPLSLSNDEITFYKTHLQKRELDNFAHAIAAELMLISPT